MSEPKPNLSEPGLYAFPHSIVIPDGKGGHHYQVCAGMTLRDYFAAQALTGIAAHWVHWTDEMRAQHAYAQADAMLAVRSVKP